MNELLDVVSDPTLVEQASVLSNPDLMHSDFGLYSLFLRADWVVKIVMIGNIKVLKLTIYYLMKN